MKEGGQEGGFLEIRVGGSFAEGHAKRPADGEHRFYANVERSSLAYGAALKAARGFLDRLEANLPVSGWSTVGLELAERARLLEVVLDTLRATPASRALQRGELIASKPIASEDPELVTVLAMCLHDARAQVRRTRGKHVPGACGGGMCAGCDFELVPWDQLPDYQKKETWESANAVLRALHRRGLVP